MRNVKELSFVTFLAVFAVGIAVTFFVVHHLAVANQAVPSRTPTQIRWLTVHGTLSAVSGIGAMILWALSVWLVSADTSKSNGSRFIILFWTIGPATYFFFEYMVFARLLHPDDLKRTMDFTDLARNIWVALVAVLVAAYVKKLPGE